MSDSNSFLFIRPEVIYLDFKAIFHTIAGKIKEAVHNIQGDSEKISIDEIAAYITKESNTIKTSRHLLGIDFHEYSLDLNKLQFLLETKGNSIEKILSLTVIKEGKAILKYKSYEVSPSSKRLISLSEFVAY